MSEKQELKVVVEVGLVADGRSNLSADIKKVIEKGGSMKELALLTEVEVLDLDTSTDAKEVEAAVSRHFGDQPLRKILVSLTKRAFRGTLEAFVELTEETASKLTSAGQLKVRWVSCEGFGHIAAGYKGPDWTTGC